LKDIKEKKIDDPTKVCKSGIEVHFRNEQYCGKMTDDDDGIKRGASPCSWCGVCFRLVE